MPKEIFIIECRTGCSCCSNENHYRGPYESQEIAERRVNFFRTSEGENRFYPLASQYARRGSYSVGKLSVEEISGGRFIVGGDKVMHDLTLVPIKPDGSLDDTSENQGSEIFDWD